MKDKYKVELIMEFNDPKEIDISYGTCEEFLSDYIETLLKPQFKFRWDSIHILKTHPNPRVSVVGFIYSQPKSLHKDLFYFDESAYIKNIEDNFMKYIEWHKELDNNGERY